MSAYTTAQASSGPRRPAARLRSTSRWGRRANPGRVRRGEGALAPRAAIPGSLQERPPFSNGFAPARSGGGSVTAAPEGVVGDDRVGRCAAGGRAGAPDGELERRAPHPPRGGGRGARRPRGRGGGGGPGGGGAGPRGGPGP